MSSDSASVTPSVIAAFQALPTSVKGEIIEGMLYTQPRPRARHMDMESFLVDGFKSPYQRGRGGPGGWWILSEPGIELPGSLEVSPDVAGWRKGRLSALPVGVWGGNDRVRAIPFEAVELDMSEWWPL